jgi:hypothetical protein
LAKYANFEQLYPYEAIQGIWVVHLQADFHQTRSTGRPFGAGALKRNKLKIN